MPPNLNECPPAWRVYFCSMLQTGPKYSTYSAPPPFSNPGTVIENGGGAEYVEYFGPVWSIEQKYTRHAGGHSFKFGGIYTSRGAGRVNSENPRFLYDNRADFLANIPS